MIDLMSTVWPPNLLKVSSMYNCIILLLLFLGYLYLLPWWGKKEKVCGDHALIVTLMFAIKTEDFSYFPPCWRKMAKLWQKKQIKCVAETSSAV